MLPLIYLQMMLLCLGFLRSPGSKCRGEVLFSVKEGRKGRQKHSEVSLFPPGPSLHFCFIRPPPPP